MKIYMISLKRDVARREAMQKRFPRYYSKFHIVDAVDAKDVNNTELIERYDKPCLSDKRKPLTLGEKCCSISHLLALQNFLEANIEHCIIIEDDLIGTDDDFDEAIALLSENKLNGLVVLGGQQGLKNKKYLCGTQVGAHKELWLIDKLARGFISRTCCYIVDKRTAKSILHSQKKCLTRADNWLCLLSRDSNIYYIKLFKHPLDLSGSNLEADRKSISLLDAIRRDGVYNLLQRNLNKLLIKCCAKYRGVQKI